MQPTPLRALGARSLLAVALLTPPLAHADLYMALGIDNESEPSLTLEFDREIGLDHWHPGLSLRLAGGVLLLPGRDGDDNAALLFTPSLRYTFIGSAWQPFIEAGIGAAVFLDTHYEGRDLASAFQFEDRLAAGMHLGAGELMVSYTHYSNADIEMPNQGLDIVALGYRVPL